MALSAGVLQQPLLTFRTRASAFRHLSAHGCAALAPGPGITADLPVDRPMYPPFDHSGWPKCMNGARIQFDSLNPARPCALCGGESNDLLARGGGVLQD
jgi:hypothetical protein